MKATHISVDNLNTNRKLANRVLKALNDITDYDNGTIKNPYELASAVMEDGRTLIQTIYEDGEICYNNGWYVVELSGGILYVDITGKAVSDMGITNYPYITDFPEFQD